MNWFSKVLKFPFFGAMMLAAVPAFAGLGTVVDSVNITVGTYGATTVVSQPDDAVGILTVDSLSVGPNEYLDIRQPKDEAAVTVIRVLGAAPSTIENAVLASGTVILINEYGFNFTPGSLVHVGSLMVSTQDYANSEFLTPDGSLTPVGDNAHNGVIDIRGRMNIGGDPFGSANLAMTAAAVQHRGWIELSEDGRVTLASANIDSFPFLQGGSAVTGNPLGSVTPGIDDQLLVTGRVHAWYGGDLDLFAEVDPPFTPANHRAVFVGGIAYVYNTYPGNGKITINGGSQGITEVGNYARYDASHTNSAGIDVTGEWVKLSGQAQLNARGQVNGGDIVIESTGSNPSDIGSGVTLDIVGETGSDGSVIIVF